MVKQYCLYILLFLIGCNHYPADVQSALHEAGGRAEELTNVLEHYRCSDKVKYRAACYLIANMPYHKSKEQIMPDTSWFQFFVWMDSIYANHYDTISLKDAKRHRPDDLDSIRRVIGARYDSLSIPKRFPGARDLDVVTAKFLIDHIDDAFRTWKETPLLCDISFDEFKEQILPYRTTDEQITYSRATLRSLFWRQIVQPGMTDVVAIVDLYKAYIKKIRWLNQYTQSKARSGLFEIFMPQFGGDCYNATTWTCNFFRATGIPVYYEYIPQWTERDARHYWCATPDANGILQPYTVPYKNLGEDWSGYIELAGKVYRRTFAANFESPYFLKAENELVPKEFDIPVIQDQTFRYRQTVTLRLPFDTPTKNQLAYLCFFTIKGIKPVGWGKIDHRKKMVVFEQVPVNLFFFMALCDDDGELYSFGDPFILKTDSILDYIQLPRSANQNQTICDVKVMDDHLVYTKKPNVVPAGLYYYPAISSDEIIPDMTLFRKYPLKPNLAKIYSRFIRAKIVGANHPEGPFETLFVFTEEPQPWMQEYELTQTGNYRYYFFRSREKYSANIDRLEFLAPQDIQKSGLHPDPLPVFPDTDTTETCLLFKINGIPVGGEDAIYAFDPDPEKFVTSQSVGVDFGTPVRITHVRMTPRNASNTINPGDRYHLLYYENNEWNLFEEKTAKYHYLRFKNVPKGTIYWLRNISRGKEELPFYYEDGKQSFIVENR